MKIHTHQRPPILRSTFKGLLLLSVILISISYLSVNKDHYLQSNTSLKQTKPIYRAPLPLELPNRTFLQHHLAFPRNYHFILDDTDVCRSNTPFLVLVVPVAPSNRKARDAIRKTWGTETLVQGELIQTVFLLGLPSRGNITEQQEHVSMENLQYHDLIQSDFTDSYNNLTIKTMVIMDWLATRCPKVSYAMKIDSDMFLNVENLASPGHHPADLGKQSVVQGKLVQTVFLLGLPTGADAQQRQGELRVESRRHRDLIQSDFHDQYRNLTIKTMMMLRWLDSHCTGASYAMKIDSDVFLNIQNLVRLLMDPANPQRQLHDGAGVVAQSRC
ncbi:unnamed protein product [Gadus morhua 'NCC']